MNNFIRSNLYNLALIFLGLVGVAIIIYTTDWGIGLFGRDSFNYISAARNLAQGYGYVFVNENNILLPITHYPPLLAIILAGFEFLHIDALVAVRFFNALLFGISAILTGILIYRTTKSKGFSLLGMVLFLSAAIFIELHSWAMSEPLFMFFTLLGFLLFDKYINRNNLALLIGLSIVLGLCFLARYVGIANILSITLSLLVLGKANLRKRLFDAAIIAILGITPVLLWTYRNFMLTQTLNNRNIGFHPPALKNFVSAFHTFFTWYLPAEIVIGYEKIYFYFVMVLILGIAVAVLIAVYKKHIRVIDWIDSIKDVHPLYFVYVSYIR